MKVGRSLVAAAARWWPRALRGLLWTVLLGACAGLALAGLARHWLSAAPGEWSRPVQVGPVSSELGIGPLWRLASHPIALRLGAGRDWPTRFGTVRWHEGPQAGEWLGECAPCRWQRPEWGSEAVAVDRVGFTLRRDTEGHAFGTLSVGNGDRAVAGRWQLRVDDAGGELNVSFADASLGDAFAALARMVPEARRARIEGRFDLQARLQLPSGLLTVAPAVRGMRVEGLGTEALIAATSSCGAAPAGGFGPWLPRAVVAAEDQRFQGHAGFDLTEMGTAWALNARAGDVVRGGSTLSQQVAKLVYTGDGRSPSRKLREWLYAVELDRTLGKARVMALYLTIAPWGEGRCGAAAAARHHLHKAPHQLTPPEAAWLASLLHNPDRELRAMARTGTVDAVRVDWVVSQMRPLPPRRWRAPVGPWLPPG